MNIAIESTSPTGALSARVEAHPMVEPVAEEWDSLADEVGAAPWLRPGWVEAWWRAFGRGRLVVLAVRQGDELGGVLPLAAHRGSLAAPTNWHTPQFGLLARRPADRAALARALLEQAPRGLTISFLDREGGLRELEEAARRRRYRVLTRVRERSPYVALGRDVDSYLATLDRKHVKEVRRLRRRLEERGEVTFGISTHATLLGEFLRVEAAGWKGEGGTAVASQPATETFYRDVASWAEERGTLRLASLRVDGRAVAYELLLEENGVLYDLKGGYDETFRRFAPGHLIAHELIADAGARGLVSFEFLGADEPFKLAWTSHVRERLHFEAFAPSPAGLATYAARVWGRPVAKRLLRR